MKIKSQTKPPKRVTWSVASSPAGKVVLGLSEKGEICRATYLGRKRAADIVSEWQMEWKRTTFTPQPAPRQLLTLPVLLTGSEFQQKVYRETMKIPLGKVMSYGEIAARIGVPRAARAVGMACGACPIAYVVPMHRVVSANGLGGFGSSGRENKWKILKSEGVHYTPIKTKTAKHLGRQLSQEDVYRKFLDVYGVKRRGD